MPGSLAVSRAFLCPLLQNARMQAAEISTLQKGSLFGLSTARC
jgi:hypothetical protein